MNECQTKTSIKNDGSSKRRQTHETDVGQQSSFQNEKTTQSMLDHYHNTHSHWIIVTIQRGINLKNKKIHMDS